MLLHAVGAAAVHAAEADLAAAGTTHGVGGTPPVAGLAARVHAHDAARRLWLRLLLQQQTLLSEKIVLLARQLLLLCLLLSGCRE